MNYIQQNAIDLCTGLQQMKWDRLEQEMLKSPAPTPPANLHRMRPSDAQLDRLFINESAPLSEAAFAQVPLHPVVNVIAGPTHSADLYALFAGEDTTHLPKQIQAQMQQIIDAFRVPGEYV